MAKTIRNMNDLSAAFMPMLKDVVKEMTERVYVTLNYFLQEYYDSYDPTSYSRQYDFLRSAVKIEPKISGNEVIACVYIDTDAMNNYRNASGYQVASWANKGLHGGIRGGDNMPHVWDETMENTIENGELLKLAVNYLRSKGFSVQVR